MNAEVRAIPEGFRTVTPSLTVRNSLEAIAFYQKAFNAEQLEVFPSPDGKGTMHATIRIGDSILMMGDERPEGGCRSAQSLGGSPVSLYVYVNDADAAFRQAVAAGATALMPVGDMFWGDRCGALKDPFGYSWNIATHKRNPSRQETEEGAKAFFAKMRAAER